jgi:VWFA-related protein
MHTWVTTNSIITMLLALGFVGNPMQNPQDPVARITTDLVQLDIVVTDRDGKLVRDLKRENFELLEDGKVQTITHFAQGTAAQPARWIMGPRPVANPSASGTTVESATAPRSRYLVLMVDDLHISPENLMLAKRALSKFTKTNLMSGDLVAIATTSGQIGLLQQFTKERAVIDRAIDRLTQQERKVASPYDIPRISDYQAELIDMNDQDAIELAVQEILKLQNPQAATAPPRGGRSASGSAGTSTGGMSERERAAQTAKMKARQIVGENAHFTTS